MPTLEHTAYELSDIADCGSPDSPDSPGAKFLLSVASDVAECLENGIPPEDDAMNLAPEIAESAVPIYTHEKWQVFVDLTAYNENIDDLGGTSGGMERGSNRALYIIAERLAINLFYEARESAEDSNED